MDTGDPDAPVRGMVDPISEADAGGATMAAMDAAVEGYVQSQTMAIGGLGAGIAFSEAIKNAARAASGDKCVFCGIKTVRSPSTQSNRSNIDHAIPKSRGGNNALENSQNACQSCNPKKGAKTTEEFLNK